MVQRILACGRLLMAREAFVPLLRELNESLENEKAVHLYVGYLYIGQDHSKANLTAKLPL